MESHLDPNKIGHLIADKTQEQGAKNYSTLCV